MESEFTLAQVAEARAQAIDFVVTLNEVFTYPLIVLLTSVALVVFMYGAFQYLLNGGNEQVRNDGRKHMIMGLIGLVIMVAAFAILTIAARTFGIDGVLEEHTAR